MYNNYSGQFLQDVLVAHSEVDTTSTTQGNPLLLTQLLGWADVLRPLYLVDQLSEFVYPTTSGTKLGHLDRLVNKMVEKFQFKKASHADMYS